jgi:hypothetical protein
LDSVVKLRLGIYGYRHYTDIIPPPTKGKGDRFGFLAIAYS